MRITLFLIILLNSLAFSQNFISVYYLKPETQTLNEIEYVYFPLKKHDVNLNGFALSWNHHLFKTEWILLKGGVKFSYSTGSFSTDRPEVTSRTDIYTGEAEISCALNKFNLKPFFSLAVGYQNYRRDAKDGPDSFYLYGLLPLKEECYPYSFSAGVEYQFIHFLSAVIYYNKRFTNYNLDDKNENYWGREINNQTGTLALGVTYIF